jgi:hypothetical protein
MALIILIILFAFGGNKIFEISFFLAGNSFSDQLSFFLLLDHVNQVLVSMLYNSLIIIDGEAK